ncbi:MAG: ATP-binding cassette domain-containing protein [Pseudomonadota bacterium]
MAGALRIRDGQISLSEGDRRFVVEIGQLDLQPGEAIAMSGPSGSGKTLALELLGLLRAPGSGTRYQIGETDLTKLWRGGGRGAALARARGRFFGFVPQSGGLIPFLSVRENIALPQRLTDRQDRDWCRDLVDRLNLNGLENLYPPALSIGQRQRVAIARALSHHPPFLIADEPTAALDPENSELVLGLMLETAQMRDCGVILSSHDLERIKRQNLRRLRFNVRAGETIRSRLEDA